MNITLKDLRPWQTSIAAIIGFAGLITVTWVSGERDRQLKLDEETRAAKSVAIGLYVEAVNIGLGLKDLELSVDVRDRYRVREVSSNAGNAALFCEGAAKFLALQKISGLGMLEVQKSNLGRLPGNLPFTYLRIVLAVDQLNRELARPETYGCTHWPETFFSGKLHYARNVRREIGQFQEELWRAYPGFRAIPELLKDNEPWKPSEPETNPITTSSATTAESASSRLRQ